jgi:integrase
MLNFDKMLKEAISRDILTISEVDDMLKMTRRKLVEQKHPYAINSSTNGRVITTVREDGKLKQISAVTMDDMIDKLYLFYFENKKNLTLNDLFPQWKEERLKDKSLNIKTVRRDNEHWIKYYKDHSIIHVPISKLTTKMLNDFFNATITKFNLSNREYNNMKSIMIALMRKAIDEEMIIENPMNGIYIKSKFRAVRKKTDGSKLYLNDEFDALDSHLEEESTIEALCIQLMFQLGVRIGEGVALKFSDIEYGKIAIQRMEEKVLVFDGENFKSAGVQIVEHLKKENDSEYRFILLTDVAKEIIRKARELNPDGEFIFERNGERLTARAVTYWLSKYCRDAGVTYKSPHCTRRTTASRLSNAGLPLDMIRDILGQVDEKTTLTYIFNPNTEQENLDIMNKAMNKGNKKNKKK